MIHKSFGIIAYKKNQSGELEFLLVKNKSGDHWGFPKGTPEADEKPEDTARREFEEETGYKSPVVLFRQTFIEEYDFKIESGTCHKICTYFLGELTSNEKPVKIFDDIEEIKWVVEDLVTSSLTFDDGRRLFAEVQKFLASSASQSF